MPLKFKTNKGSLVSVLETTSAELAGRRLTLRELLELIGEQGLLLVCILLTLPFMLPVSIPGVSSFFGVVIILIGIGITLNRIPWIPERLLAREIEGEQLVPVLTQGIALLKKVETFIKPRWMILNQGAGMNGVNGGVLTFAAIMLLFPLGLIPFSNTMPALAILLCAIGIAEHDGVFIVAGYFMTALTVIYFGALAIGVLSAGQAVTSLLGG